MDLDSRFIDLLLLLVLPPPTPTISTAAAASFVGVSIRFEVHFSFELLGVAAQAAAGPAAAGPAGPVGPAGRGGRASFLFSCFEYRDMKLWKNRKMKECAV